MEQINERENEIIQFLQPYMQECVNKLCKLIQIEIETYGNEIWKELKNVICNMLKHIDAMQKRCKKKEIKYIVFSFMRYSFYLNKFELCIQALDSGFYLDEQPVVAYFNLDFLQNEYVADCKFLCKKVEERFIRTKNHELIDIKKWYVDSYDFIIFQMIKSLTELIMEVIMESDMEINDEFKILYGEYMDKVVVLGTKEKYESEIFSD